MRADGKVDVACPQCGTGYRVPEQLLDEKMECAECHRVFFPKTTAGKRVKPPDYTKAYVGFGVGAVAIIALFALMGGGGGERKQDAPVVQAPKAPVHGVGTHPRAQQLVKWAQAIGNDNPLVADTHSDLAALGTMLGVGTDRTAVLEALRTHEATRYLRELACESGALSSEADMDAPRGTGVLFVTPKPGDDRYQKNTRGELEVAFRMEGEQVKVTSIGVRMKPVWNPIRDDPSLSKVRVETDIAAPTEVTVTDSAGNTRTVQQSKVAPVPHWRGASEAQQAFADGIVADLLRSADPEAPAVLYNRTLAKVRTREEKKAVVPRILNAMYELHGDVNANNLKLSQLNSAMKVMTGFSVNYRVENDGDDATMKAAREASVSQWFAFWWRYANDLDKWFDERENLDEPLDAAPAKRGN